MANLSAAWLAYKSWEQHPMKTTAARSMVASSLADGRSVTIWTDTKSYDRVISEITKAVSTLIGYDVRDRISMTVNPAPTGKKSVTMLLKPCSD